MKIIFNTFLFGLLHFCVCLTWMKMTTMTDIVDLKHYTLYPCSNCNENDVLEALQYFEEINLDVSWSNWYAPLSSSKKNNLYSNCIIRKQGCLWHNGFYWIMVDFTAHNTCGGHRSPWLSSCPVVHPTAHMLFIFIGYLSLELFFGNKDYNLCMLYRNQQ